MAPKPRKRPADPLWTDHATSKVSRTDYSRLSPPVPLHRRSVCTSSPRIPTQASSTTPRFGQRSAAGQIAQPHLSTPHRTTTQGASPRLQHQPDLHVGQGQSQAQHGSHSAQPVVYKARIMHAPHPDSRVCQDFHWLPYPLGLMPFDSWHKLHTRPNVYPPLPFRCPVCRAERKPTPHNRKLFLVAERLTWEEGLGSGPKKDQNEELNWEVNYELGILEPFVEDPEQVPGGKHSQQNKFYPYKNEYEMVQALNLIFTSDNITEVSWSLWIGLQMDLQKMLDVQEISVSDKVSQEKPSDVRRPLQLDNGNHPRTSTPNIDEIDLTVSPNRVSKHPTNAIAFGIPTPPSSFTRRINNENLPPSPTNAAPSSQRTSANFPRDIHAGWPSNLPSSPNKECITSYKTLQDFYSLLDRIERTSFVGALFLEKYAERLRDDMCRKCWLNRYIDFNALDS